MLLNNPYRFGSWTPDQLPSVKRWWDADDPASLTVVTLEVTSWLDQIASADLLKDGNGPSEVTVGGRNLLHFDRANSERLKIIGDTAVDPGASEVTYIAVFRVIDNTQGAVFGKIGGSVPNNNFGMFMNVTTPGSLYWQMRDNIGGNTLILHDTATDWGDNVIHIASITYKDAEGDAFMFMDDLQPQGSAEVDSDLAYASNAIGPTNPFYVGNWDTGTNHLTFDLSDIIVCDSVLTNVEMQRVQDWASLKHSLGLS